MSDEDILDELKKLTRLITLGFSDEITTEIGKFASTDERKMIWVLIDGKRTNKTISSITGSTTRTIQRFRKILEEADLIENPWGKPATKKIKHVPAEWIDLLPSE